MWKLNITSIKFKADDTYAMHNSKIEQCTTVYHKVRNDQQLQYVNDNQVGDTQFR